MTPSTLEGAGPDAKRSRRRRRRLLVAYAALLALSFAVRGIMGAGARASEPAERGPVGLAAPARGAIAYLQWPDDARVDSGAIPIILLHGSPGEASNFNALGPRLARDGRRVIAIDQLGFGRSSAWPGDYSILANARAVVALLDALSIPRAHILGWSNGGGTALHIADLAPDRVASLTLLASIGVQETEGSGSHAFEHFKYTVGVVAAHAVEAIPHFGLLGRFSERVASMRFFADSDQRPLRRIMHDTRVPTLILHGRRDFLVPAWAAIEHHRLMPASRLVMLDASHFIPFLQPEEACDVLTPFLARHDAPGVPPETGRIDLAPPVERGWTAIVPETVILGARNLPIGVHLLAIAIVALWSFEWAVLVAALLSSAFVVDFGVGISGLLAAGLVQALAYAVYGRAVSHQGLRFRHADLPHFSLVDWSRRLDRAGTLRLVSWATLSDLRRELLLSSQMLGRRRVVAIGATAAAHALVIGACFAGVLAWIAATADPAYRAAGPVGFAGSAALGWLMATSIRHAMSWIGRRRLLAKLDRITHYEYWPSWIFYAPLFPYLAWLTIRYRGALVFTACNPGIPKGGGFVGESKAQIIDHLHDDPEDRAVLPAALIAEAPTSQARVAELRRALAERPELGGFPIILKPDSAQRGFAVRLVHGFDEALEYFHEMTRPAIAQRYHPGPNECGVLWARRAGAPDRGFIYSITRKEFPVIAGDGVRTLEQLVYRHRRFRRQAGTFLARWADERSAVLDRGRLLRLAMAGNHCQGTLFRDGADLITPELERRIDAIARRFAGAEHSGGGLDFGRFDVRYETDEALRDGRGFAIVELNGTTGESTNLYDPGKWIGWAYAVLFGQWKLLYALGAMRRGQGHRVMKPRELISTVRAYYKERPGSAVAS